MEPQDLFESTVELLQRRWKAVPLWPQTKKPKTQWIKQSMPSRSDVAWWIWGEECTGIGAIPAIGDAVVDVDWKHGAKGKEHWEALEAAHGAVNSRTITTGSGASQIIVTGLRGPLCRCGLLRELQRLLGSEAPTSIDDLGIDLRTAPGEGNLGYVVVPESECLDEDEHEHGYSSDYAEIEICPEWLAGLLKAAGCIHDPASNSGRVKGGAIVDRDTRPTELPATAALHLNTPTAMTTSEDAWWAFHSLRNDRWALDWIADELEASPVTGSHYKNRREVEADVARMEKKWSARTTAPEELAELRAAVVAGRHSGLLSRAQAAVLDGLLDSADLRKSRSFACSYRDLILATGMHTRSIQRTLQSLIGNGWLEKGDSQPVPGSKKRSTWSLRMSLVAAASASPGAHSPVSQMGGDLEPEGVGTWALGDSSTALGSVLGGGDGIKVLKKMLSAGLDVEFTRRQLHEMTGVPKRTVERIVVKLARAGLVDAGTKVRLLLDADGLEEASASMLWESEAGVRQIERRAQVETDRIQHQQGRVDAWVTYELEVETARVESNERREVEADSTDEILPEEWLSQPEGTVLTY